MIVEVHRFKKTLRIELLFWENLKGKLHFYLNHIIKIIEMKSLSRSDLQKYFVENKKLPIKTKRDSIWRLLKSYCKTVLDTKNKVKKTLNKIG